MRKVVSVLSIILIVALPFIHQSMSGIFKTELTVSLISAIVSTLLLIFSITALVKKDKKINVSINLPDIAVCLLFIYGLTNLYLLNPPHGSTAVLMKWLAIILIYVTFRLLPDKRPVMYGFVLSGVIQALFAFSQRFYLFESNHLYFDVTGSFPNPAPLGGYLAVCLIISGDLVIRCFKQSQRKQGIVLILASAIILSGLILSDSRAAWLAAIIGLSIIALHHTPNKVKLKRQITIPIAVLALFVVVVLLYNYRPASANARLLTWRVSADMIADRQLTGHGVNSFSNQFMLYQAEYFKSHPDSKYAFVADNTSYAYNELIKITVEQGIIGLCLLLFVVLAALYTNGKRALSLKAAFLGLVVFSLFSYPSSVASLMLSAAIILGSLETRGVVVHPIKQYALSLCLFCMLLTGQLCFSISQYRFYIDAEKHSSNRDIPWMTQNKETLMNNRIFNAHYHSLLMRSDTDYDINESDVLPTSELYCSLGDYYLERGDRDAAERAYLTASHMIPTRLRPNYNLWRLYVKDNNPSAAHTMAERIMTMPLKNENSFTIKAKSDVRKYIEGEQY